MSFLLISVVFFIVVNCREVERRVIQPCPPESRPMYRPDREPRKCLPHQNSLCLNALPDKPNADTVCCWFNQIDYYCCLDVKPKDCPDYQDVTAVVQHAYPSNPFALRSYHFKEGIENDIADILKKSFRRLPASLEELPRTTI